MTAQRQNDAGTCIQGGRRRAISAWTGQSSRCGLVHVEDFAQIFGLYPDDKYGNASVRNIATVLARESSNDDIAEFVRRLTFNTLIGLRFRIDYPVRSR